MHFVKRSDLRNTGIFNSNIGSAPTASDYRESKQCRFEQHKRRKL